MNMINISNVKLLFRDLILFKSHSVFLQLYRNIICQLMCIVFVVMCVWALLVISMIFVNEISQVFKVAMFVYKEGLFE